MRQIELGNTGLKVSALCLGTLYMGTKEDEATSFRILDQYAEAGGTFLDCANIYAYWIDDRFVGGESNSVVGRWMKARGNRQDMLVANKVGIEYPGQKGGLSARQIVQECDKSLREMQTDYFDLYFSHADDRDTPLEETMEAFHRLVQSGKVRVLGASNFMTWRLAQANLIAKQNQWTQYGVLQQRHTYLRPKKDMDFGLQVVLTEDMIDHCRSSGMGIMGYTPTIEGSYNPGSKRDIQAAYDTAANQQRLDELYRVAGEAGATPLQTVLAWLMASDPPVIPLITGSKAEQMEENIGSLNVKLTDEHVARLDHAGDYLASGRLIKSQFGS